MDPRGCLSKKPEMPQPYTNVTILVFVGDATLFLVDNLYTDTRMQTTSQFMN